MRDKNYSTFGDVHCSEKTDALFQRGLKLLPTSERRRAVSVRYRPCATIGNQYEEGTLTIFFRRPRQLLGPWRYRSARLERGEYFKLIGVR